MAHVTTHIVDDNGITFETANSIISNYNKQVQFSERIDSFIFDYDYPYEGQVIRWRLLKNNGTKVFLDELKWIFTINGKSFERKCNE